MKRVNEEQARFELNRYAQNITKDDISKILGDEASIMKRVRGPLAKFIEDIQLLFAMIKDYFSGAYQEIPWKTIAMVIGALVYVLSPIDLIPDVIPFLGLIDDAAVMTFCLSRINADVQKYRQWKETASTALTVSSDAHNDEERRKAQGLDEAHAKQMETLQKSLEQTTMTMFAGVSLGTLGEVKYSADKPEVEDIQVLHKELEQIKDRFRSRGQQIEKTMRSVAQVSFDVMINEVKRIISNTGIYIDLNKLDQKFDRVLGQITGAVTDVINRRVSLGDAECTEILRCASRDDREERLADFLKKAAAESIRNVQERVDDALWDAQVTVASIITNRLDDKRGQIQRTVEEYVSMKNILSASETAEKNTRYKEEIKELNDFITFVDTH